MQMRFAETESDRVQVFRQRYRVYAQEMHLSRETADHERKTLSDADDQTARLFAAFDGSGAVGSLRVHVDVDRTMSTSLARRFHVDRFAKLVPPVNLAVISRLTIDPERRASRLAVELLIELTPHLLDLGTQLVILDCPPQSVSLYSPLGFRPYASNVDETPHGILVPMVLVTGDLGYLRAIRSPLADVIAKHDRLPTTPPGLAGILGAGANPPTDGVADAVYWSVVEKLQHTSALDSYGILAELSDEQRCGLLTDSHVVESRRGDMLIKKGSIGRSMFIVLDGTVSVRDGDRLIAMRGPGSVIGEIAFLVDVPRTADVKAETDVTTLSLDERTVRKFIREDTLGAARLLLNLARLLCLKLVEKPLAPAIAAST